MPNFNKDFRKQGTFLMYDGSAGRDFLLLCKYPSVSHKVNANETQELRNSSIVQSIFI